ncbi:Casein kinase I isoform delta [Beauveria bassiana]|nr:Casein kinase I isoform delta [Beauveria bassiana]
MRFVINNRYNLEFKIAEGGFSFGYLGTDLQNGSREVALKLYHFKDKNELKFPIHEARVLADINGIVLEDINGNVLDDINGNKGIPTIYWSGRKCEYHVIAQELLGPTLYALLDQFRVFSFKTTLLIADQAIERLEFIHSKGYLHGDIKPANMAMGQGEHGNLLYFLDFGSARKFGHDEEWKSRHGEGFFSTDLYASPNIIDGKGCVFSPPLKLTRPTLTSHTEWSWADDLESLGYVLLRFYGGKLNWIINCKHNNCDVLQSPWRCKLQRPSVREMCKGLPKEFFEYFRHIRSLEHGQKPDYDHLRELFRCASRNRGYQYDNIYDWTSKWFNEVHSIKSTPKEQSELVEKQITTSLTPHELASAGGSIEMQL